MSTALTLTPYRRCTPERNRSIPTISAGFLGGRLGNVSAVDTSPRRSESGVIAARPGASVTGPSPPSPARRLRWGPVVMVGRRLRSESRLGSACSTRGGIYWPRVVRTARRPHLPKVPPPSSSSTPPSCSASRRRRQPPQRPGQPLRQVESAALPSGRHTLNRCLEMS